MEAVQVPEEELDLFQLYMKSQLCAILFGIRSGLVKNGLEWIEKYGEVFQMVMKGAIEVPCNTDWMKLRQQIKELTNKQIQNDETTD